MSSTRAIFVSDVHLNHPKDEIYVRFQSFLDDLVRSQNCSHLFLVGDIFDLWIGNHQYFIDRHQSVIRSIQTLIRQGTEVHYFEGNHDLYLKSFWQDRLNCRVHPGPAHFKVDGLDLRVEHGDQMDPTDRGYLWLRWFLRTSLMKWVARVLPGFLVRRIGERMSAMSRSYTSQVHTLHRERAQRVIREHAESLAGKEEFDCIITGHVHCQDEYVFQSHNRTVKSFNLGSWLNQPVFLEVSKSLQHFVLL